ncbi:MAG: division/cell wall cluster transcriptional repressor MraZ [Legionellaceae bacterium]|nr:division/cell wall cluster transcriptional repressor MraZ [Legionellaceae bacterium]
MFRGINAVTLDAKGRLAIPTRYRDALAAAPTCIVTIDTEESCLLLYPLDAWKPIEAKILQLPSFNPASRRIQRLLIGHATEVEFDTHGRFVLPPLLREYAALEKQAVMIGQGHKFEIWGDKAWQAKRQDWLTEAARAEVLPDEMKDIAL